MHNRTFVIHIRLEIFEFFLNANISDEILIYARTASTYEYLASIRTD